MNLSRKSNSRLFSKLWLLVLFFAQSSFAATTMREKLQHATPGTYVVFESQKTRSLLHIHSKNDSTMILEEIVTSQMRNDWADWIAKGAENHQSWMQYEFDLATGDLLECYSFTHRSWMKLSDHLLTTLMNLPLESVPDSERKRVGPTPPHHAIDIRRLWNPPAAYPGQQFNVHQSHWPKDDSEIAGKKVELYFDTNDFPLPHWIEIHGKIDAKIRTIAHGSGLQSPNKHLPRRYPRPIGSYEKRPETYRLKIDCPPYYHDFNVYAYKQGAVPRAIHCLFDRQHELLVIDLPHNAMRDDEELALTPESHPHIFVELPPLPKNIEKE